jgi:hypothetical protein
LFKISEDKTVCKASLIFWGIVLGILLLIVSCLVYLNIVQLRNLRKFGDGEVVGVKENAKKMEKMRMGNPGRTGRKVNRNAIKAVPIKDKAVHRRQVQSKRQKPSKKF